VFTPEERERVRTLVLERARADERISAAALLGSGATGTEDRWSDIDLTFGVAGEVDPVLADWTSWAERELQALHHFDLRVRSTVYRVFLLPGCLEVDLSFTPASEFGPRGPNWRTVFGETVDLPFGDPPAARDLVGMGWLSVLDANLAIHRGRAWQAEYFVSTVRDHALAIACLRLGENATYARGVDRLPREVTEPFEEALVRSLEDGELRRALVAATRCLLGEVKRTDAGLADRLEAPLLEAAAG
jgi:hypothetical protein